MSVLKTNFWQQPNETLMNVPIQVVHKTYTDLFATNRSGVERIPIPGFHVDITPTFPTSQMIVIVSLAMAFQGSSEWSWFVDRTVVNEDVDGWEENYANWTRIGIGTQLGSRMIGYHGGPRDGNAGDSDTADGWSRDLESFYHIVYDTPDDTVRSPLRYQVCLQDKWSGGQFDYVNYTSEDSNNGYITRGSSSITVMEIPR